MKIKERILIAVLLIILAIITIPLTSNAATQEKIDVSTQEEFIEKIEEGNKYINLIADIDFVGDYVVVDITGCTIDLNEHKITTDCHNSGNQSFYSLIFVGENFVIKNGICEARVGSYSLFIGDDVSANNGTIENVTTIGGINLYNSTNIVIKDSNIESKKFYAIWCDYGGQAIIESGNFKSDANGTALIGMSRVESLLEIKGGNFETNGKPLVLKSGDSYGKPEISDGIFDVPVAEEYCKGGYEPVALENNNYSVCNHSKTELKNVKEETCTESGYTGDTYCSKCNKSMASGVEINPSGHQLIHYDAVLATCVESEKIEYWSCDKCKKNFSSEECNVELTSIEGSPALGHSPSEWKYDKESHWKICTNEGCGAIIAESKDIHTYDNNSSKCKICSYELEKNEEIEKPETPEEPEKPGDIEEPIKPSENEKPKEEEKEDTPTISNIVDKKTNIELKFEKNVLPNDIELQVSQISEGKTYANVKKVLSNMNKFMLFDINLLCNGVKIQPKGKVRISIPIPDDFDKTKLVVYKIEGNDKKEYAIQVIEINDVYYAQFETDHFSNYALGEKAESIIEANDAISNEKDESPETGIIDKNYFILPIVFTLLFGIIIVIKKK